MESSRNEWSIRYKLCTHWVGDPDLDRLPLPARVFSVHAVCTTLVLSPWLLPRQTHCHRVTGPQGHRARDQGVLISLTSLLLCSKAQEQCFCKRSTSWGRKAPLVKNTLYLWSYEEGKRNPWQFCTNCKVTVTVCKFQLKMETTLNYRARYHVCPEGLGMQLPRMKGDHC